MISLARVKELCTEAEHKIIKASRLPELEKLTAERIKQLSAQARKLHDKWHGLSRQQARGRSRATGFGTEQARTSEKVNIFRDAIDHFGQQLAKLEAGVVSAVGKKTAKVKVPKSERTAGARVNRAVVRVKLAEQEAEINAGKHAARAAKAAKAKPAKVKPAAAKTVAQPAPAPVAKAPAKKKRPTRKALKPKATKPAPSGLISPLTAQPQLAPGLAKNLKAGTAAKQRVLVKSGITTRMKGHTMARGKRQQARRDAAAKGLGRGMQKRSY